MLEKGREYQFVLYSYVQCVQRMTPIYIYKSCKNKERRIIINPIINPIDHTEYYPTINDPIILLTLLTPPLKLKVG
jgi:hypothetical protein